MEDEYVCQIEGAAQHDNGDAVGDGGGHGEEVPEALTLQRLRLLLCHLRRVPVDAVVNGAGHADPADK